MESVQSLVSAVTLLTSCVIVSVFVPPEIIVNNDAIDIVPPVYKHPFIEPSVPLIDEKPYEEEIIPSYEEEIVIIEPPPQEENITEEYFPPEIIEEEEEEGEEIITEPVVEEVEIETPKEKLPPISDVMKEYANKGKVIGLKLLTEPQYSHFRILVDVVSIILCILLFKYCARKRELPSSILAKQAELNKLNYEVSSRIEEDKNNAATIAKTGPDLQQMNSDYRNEVKKNEELQQQLKYSSSREDIEQQEQDSVEDEMKRLESEEDANLQALKNKNNSITDADKIKLAKEEAELLRIKEEENKARIAKEQEQQQQLQKLQQEEEIKKNELALKEQLAKEQILREQQEKQRQEILKETLSKGVDPEEIYIGSKVLVNGSELGIVRHIGSVNGLAGNYYGVEFDVPVGKNDGTGPNGDRYFVTKKNQGLFVTREKLSLVK